MRRLSSSTWLLSLLGLGLSLGLAACSGDDTGTSDTNASATTSSTSNDTSSSTTGETTDDSSTTASETTTESTTASTTDATTTDATTTTSTTDTTDATTTDTTTDSGGGACGDGVVDGNEVCDDGNTKTEPPGNGDVPHSYGDGDCLDACDLLAPTCGDGNVDPGEECDDGNTNGQDDCSTSCTTNDGGFDSPCTRDCGNNDCSANDVLEGTIVGCENVTAPAGTEKVCFESGNVKLLNIIDRKLYFAQGSCMVAAQKCEGAFCPGYVTFGDYDGFNDCPAGTSLADRVTDEGGVKVSTKVCHKTCESDSDCRWNDHDDYWGAPGQWRCQVTPDSNGAKICADAQNF
ncbi:MAG: hypothetical protein R3A79_15555 [Nannocystaceae bacterium]